MISIAICSSLEETITLKSMIQDFLIENKMMAKISKFTNLYDLVVSPTQYDLYIIDLDEDGNGLEIGKKLMEINPDGHYIYISNDINNAYLATKIRANYFLEKPIDKEDFLPMLKKIKNRIQDDTIIIKISTGERRVRINMLNYINIVKRCLCYHLSDGTMFDGQVLRTAFEKAIDPLPNHKSKAFLFLAPSLLINVGEIKILNSDHIIFENDDVLYFPKKSYDKVREAWLNYSRIMEN
jgi:hypothetical protein